VKSKIYVSRIDYYGRTTIKPECSISLGLCKLLKQKTLTLVDIDNIKALGFSVHVKSVTVTIKEEEL